MSDRIGTDRLETLRACAWHCDRTGDPVHFYRGELLSLVNGYGPDALMRGAKRFVQCAGRGSTATMQRQFFLSYHEATQVIDRLIEDGVLSPRAEDGSWTVRTDDVEG
jgi:DNA segregation ATPase FtsK/SpoIIIE-like protein